jgi:hypothetical protein
MRAWLAAALLLLAQRAPIAEYRDPQGAFRFTHPRSYGMVSPGTNDGFQGRRSVRFSSFPAVLGGELVLTRGFPYVDLQAIGGLYDSIALEIFPAPLRTRIVASLPRLTAMNFGDALGRTTHVDVDAPSMKAFTASERTAIHNADLMRSVDPKVVRCESKDSVIVFDRETAFQAGAPRQHIFGAIRFLETGELSSVQLVAGDSAPRAGVIDDVAAIVGSVAFR